MKKRRLLKAFSFLLLVSGIILVSCGTTLAWVNFQGLGQTVHSISNGAITFRYNEGSSKIVLRDAMPMTYEEGRNQENYFEFNINSDNYQSLDLPYYVTVRKSADSSDIEDAITLYLTEVDEMGNERVVKKVSYDNLDTYTNHVIDLNNYNEKLLFTASVNKLENVNRVYRLRMWLDTNADFTQEKYNNAKFEVTVNVYSSME